MITLLLWLFFIAAVLRVVSTFAPRLGTFGKLESQKVALPLHKGLAFLLLSGIGILACESPVSEPESSTSPSQSIVNEVRDILIRRKWTETEVDEIVSKVIQRGMRQGEELTTVVRELLKPYRQSPPDHGTVTKESLKEAIAPLQILTRTARKYYFVKLVDWTTKETIMTGFIHGGTPLNIEVPLGSYGLRYGVLEDWYGPSRFGPEAVFSRADERFDFIREGDQVQGYSVELILQTAGNLETEQIPPEAF